MNVYRSNRVERLLDPLARELTRPSPNLIAPQQVVVNSKGMERWLSMQLAQRTGICANLEFPFPFRVLHESFEAVLGPQAKRLDAWTREPLSWAVLATLPGLLGEAAFMPLRRYVNDDPLKLQQLSRRIAATFDRYILYRHDMVRRWEEGADSHWQAQLWRALAQRIEHPHLGRLERPFFDRMLSRAEVAGLPERISVFGISTLPPMLMRVFAVLARHTHVNLFLLCPSDQYWADLASRQKAEFLSRVFDLDRQELHLDVGNPLLGSLGRLGQDFQKVLEENADYGEPEPKLFETPPLNTLLGTLQRDILNLTDRNEVGPVEPIEGDRTISVHACHGAIRQVEVLQDQLLDLFDRLPTLQPRDVVVMMPDVETWSPLVHAVFDRSRDDDRYIPYRVADRSLRRDNPVAEGLLAVLGLVDARLTATEVLDLLGHDPVRERFAVLPTELEDIAEWIRAAGIRWGMDADHRVRWGQPAADGLNTWRFGLDRLLLGTAVPGRGRILWQDVLPYDEIEGHRSRLLGRLVDFCETLFGTLRRLRLARTPADWERELGRIMDTLLASTEDNAWQHLQVRTRLEDMVKHAESAGFDAQLEVEQIRAWLGELFDERVPASGFLSGQLTFCAMVPMRTIPFRVICLLGMDEGAYPRRHTRMGFDLIAQKPRAGDRSPREDDRYLFLETLLSARDALVITYAGRSIRDNKQRPPSVLVAELLDTLDETFSGEPTRKRVVVEHPLQPFSKRCFDVDQPDAVRSYDKSALRGAMRRQEPPQRPAPLFRETLPPVPPDERNLTVAQLVAFLKAPVKYVLTKRLGIRLDSREDRTEDREPLALDGLGRWSVAAPLLDRATSGEELERSFESVRRRGVLPLGVPGECTFDEIRSLVEVVAGVVTRQKALLGDPVDPQPVDLVFDSGRLGGTLSPLRERGILQATWSKVAAKHLLEAWVLHLVQCMHRGPHTTVLVGRHPRQPGALHCTFRPVADPAKRLNVLVRMYWRNWEGPVPFFPATSFAFIEAGGDSPNPEQTDRALGSSRWKWGGKWGESTDAYVGRVFGSEDPLDPNWAQPRLQIPALGFHKYASFVYRPMLEHLDRKQVKA